MVRKLKYHEKKLLKKVDFLDWEVDQSNLKEVKVMRKFNVSRTEYTAYNKLSREIRVLAGKIQANEKKAFGILAQRQLCQKLYDMGIITIQKLGNCHDVSASSFCRRRLPVVVTKSKMADNLQDAIKYVEHGHIRVGPECVKDPAMLVTRSMEDFITWADTSSIKLKVQEYNEIRDDYDLAE
ncbi:IMP3 [Bugula neritina]|uniref:U3 small nucleolar ribonucleoprotein protein IMP3 n=1 Tax=Bugula neritina TaxID=10212 RepID=A0A7J7KMU6_BUGNE|nr:IMP3 [Bugula neritina]